MNPRAPISRSPRAGPGRLVIDETDGRMIRFRDRGLSDSASCNCLDLDLDLDREIVESIPANLDS
jgi:hypothetical protein